MKTLLTGCAGFIGMYAAQRLLDAGHEVVGIDNLNDYYDPALKDYRLSKLLPHSNFRFIKLDLADREGMAELFAREKFDRVIHLAAQAGVRYSLKNPFAEGDFVDQPVSLYAATKKSNELMAHSYSKLYGIPTTGLRFFTVYGPAGRPDMAPWLFTEAILNDQPIKVFNHGKMQRDFTYIDDIVEGVIRIQDVIPTGEIPYSLYNIGNNQPIELSRFIKAIETATGKTAEKIYLDMQPGDVKRTYADIDRLEAAVGYKPATSIEEGIERFVGWYRCYKMPQSDK